MIASAECLGQLVQGISSTCSALPRFPTSCSTSRGQITASFYTTASTQTLPLSLVLPGIPARMERPQSAADLRPTLLRTGLPSSRQLPPATTVCLRSYRIPSRLASLTRLRFLLSLLLRTSFPFPKRPFLPTTAELTL